MTQLDGRSQYYPVVAVGNSLSQDKFMSFILMTCEVVTQRKMKDPCNNREMRSIIRTLNTCTFPSDLKTDYQRSLKQINFNNKTTTDNCATDQTDPNSMIFYDFQQHFS